MLQGCFLSEFNTTWLTLLVRSSFCFFSQSRGDVVFTVTQRHVEPLHHDIVDPLKLNKPRPAANKIREVIEKRTGSFYFVTNAEMDTIVEVCIQSYLASKKDPTRVGLDIQTSEEIETIEDEGREALSAEEYATIQTHNRVLRDQSSGISKEMAKLERKIGNIMRDSKLTTRTAARHKDQSIKLHRAIRNWPMFRTAVLMLGGFLQVRHVLNYMKKRHIY